MYLGASRTSTYLFSFLLLVSSVLIAEGKEHRPLNKTAAEAVFTKLNLNNITTFIHNDAQMDLAPSGNSGFEYPRKSGLTAVFQSGFVFGSLVNGKARVGGVTYNSGLQPGKILSPNKAEDPKLPKNRPYRVRPDYKSALLDWEVLDERKNESEIRSQYERDWKEWPAADGAPFTDINNNGKYDPETDIPGVKDAVQTVWFVVNDMDQSKSQVLYGSPSSGLELQITMWTYDNDFNLKNTIFKKYKIINKSSDLLSQMHVALWSDPEVGDAGNDFAGVDTTLGLGFCYNAVAADSYYSTRPPAVGFDLLQGPVVSGLAGDTAIFNGKKIAGKKNLPVTSFFYHNSGLELSDVTLGSNYDNTLRWWNLLQGKLSRTREYYPVPASLGGGTTKFPLSGDPVNGSGYLDGMLYTKGDRRMGINCGPFNMAPGDTQEIVYAQMAAQGSSNIASVAMLKNMDAEIQKKYNSLFSSVQKIRPPAPKLMATYNKDNIILTWPKDNEVENFDQGGYKFQGYNLYQLNPDLPEIRYGVKLATFDLIDGITKISGEDIDTLTGKPGLCVLQNGNDSGIKRILNICRDSLMHTPLLIGKNYLYALTAYTYRNDLAGKLTASESPLGYSYITYQEGVSGLKYRDTLSAIRSAGNGEATVTPVVIDAAGLTGHDYQVFFTQAGDSVTWSLKDLNTGAVLLKDKRMLNEVDLKPDAYYPIPKTYLLNSQITDGINVNVIDPQPGMKGWEVPKGSLKWSSKNANNSYYPVRGFDGAIGDGYIDWPKMNVVYSPVTKPGRIPHVLIKFVSTDNAGNILNPSDPNVSYAYRYLRNVSVSAAKPEFEPFIINKTYNYTYQDFRKNFPFAAYNYETGERLSVGFLENNVAAGMVDGKYWPPSDSLTINGNSSGSSPREWFFIFDKPYSETPDAALQTSFFMSPIPVIWFGMPTRKGNSAFSSEDQFLIKKTNMSAAGDTYTFRTDNTAGKSGKPLPGQYSLSQNYPNPFNPVTTIKYSVKENVNVEIKVYDMLGREVRTLVNEMHLPGEYRAVFDGTSLTSGVYIYTIRTGGFTDSRKLLLLK